MPRVLVSKTVNFVFIRHGNSCQQITKDFKNEDLYFHQFADPTLTDAGVKDTVEAGKFLKDFLEKRDLKVDIIGSSPMLRALETAYYTDLGLSNTSSVPSSPSSVISVSSSNSALSSPRNKTKIYAFPFLRECYNCDITDTPKVLNDVWPMKRILEQDIILKKQGATVDFSYVSYSKQAAGSISDFINWFFRNFPGIRNGMTVLICTHGNVIRAVTSFGPSNNNGFAMKVTYDSDRGITVEEKTMIKCDIVRSKVECPTTRCPGICEQNIFEEVLKLSQVMGETPLKTMLKYKVLDTNLLKILIQKNPEHVTDQVIFYSWLRQDHDIARILLDSIDILESETVEKIKKSKSKLLKNSDLVSKLSRLERLKV